MTAARIHGKLKNFQKFGTKKHFEFFFFFFWNNKKFKIKIESAAIGKKVLFFQIDLLDFIEFIGLRRTV